MELAKKMSQEVATFWNNLPHNNTRGQIIFDLCADFDIKRAKFKNKSFSQLNKEQKQEVKNRYYIYRNKIDSTGSVSYILRHEVNKRFNRLPCECFNCEVKRKDDVIELRDRARGRVRLTKFHFDLNADESEYATVVIRAIDLKDAIQFYKDHQHDLINNAKWEGCSPCGEFDIVIEEIRQFEGHKETKSFSQSIIQGLYNEIMEKKY